MPVDIEEGDTVDEHLSALGDGGTTVEIPPGAYVWEGDNLELDSGDELIGGGDPGDVVFALDPDATMSGTVGNGAYVENITVRGANGASKSGIDVEPGAHIHHFVWPEGGQQDEDRAFYSPEGGADRLRMTGSLWANCVSDGAYVDKPLVTMENCVSVNNNVSGIRVGYRGDTPADEVTYIRNCLVAVTDDIQNDSINSKFARGVRVRHPAHVVIENCWFVYFDVEGTAQIVELHDEAAPSTVEIRNCHFHNDSDVDLVRVKGDESQFDLTVEDCTFSGSGSDAIDHGNYSGNGVTTDTSVTVPTPAQVTGVPQAASTPGLDAARSPFGEADVEGPTDGEESDSGGDSGSDGTEEPSHLFEVVSAQTGELTYEFTTDGRVELDSTSESVTAGHGDNVTDNGDGTYTVTGTTGNVGYGDAYRVYGEITSFSASPEDFDYTLYLDGQVAWPSDFNDTEETDDGTDDTDGGSGDTTTGLTEEDVRAIVEEELAALELLTEEDVRAIVEEEAGSLTESEVEAIVRAVVLDAFQ